MTSRAYCFTSFKYLSFVKDFNDSFEQNKSKIRYVIAQHEKCPETGRDHIQGYIELHEPMRMNAVKKLLCDEAAHLETRKGTRDQVNEDLYIAMLRHAANHAAVCCDPCCAISASIPYGISSLFGLTGQGLLPEGGVKRVWSLGVGGLECIWIGTSVSPCHASRVTRLRGNTDPQPRITS